MPIISVRITEKEKLQLQEKAKRSGMTESRYVRRIIFEPQAEDMVDRHRAMNILADMFTDINHVKEFEDSTKIKSIEKGVKELWQILL